MRIRSASASGLARSASAAQPLLPQRHRRLRRECLEHLPVGRVEQPAPYGEHQVVVDGHVRVGMPPARWTAGPPAVATTCHESPSRSSSVTDSRPNTSLSLASRAGSAASPRRTWPASVDSTSASARERAASLLRRAAWSTTVLTIAATSTKMDSANRFSGAEIVSVWSGGVKNQFSSAKPSTAADQRRPHAAHQRDGDDQQQEEQDLARQREPLGECQHDGCQQRNREQCQRPAGDPPVPVQRGRRAGGTAYAREPPRGGPGGRRSSRTRRSP